MLIKITNFPLLTIKYFLQQISGDILFLIYFFLCVRICPWLNHEILIPTNHRNHPDNAGMLHSNNMMYIEENNHLNKILESNRR